MDTYFKDSYGRGVGTIPPLDGSGCASQGKQNVAGLCYTPCRTGYGDPVGLPYICRDLTPCRNTYTDTGIGCTRGLIVTTQKSRYSERP